MVASPRNHHPNRKSWPLAALIIGNESSMHFVLQPLLGRITRRMSREPCVPKRGGFETRPYEPPDLGAASRKRLLWTPAEFRSGSMRYPIEG